MAYQTRGREPLLDSNTQAALEKRGKELLGLGLIALGLMVAMMIGSYSPDDPNWMLASDAPVQNWLGRFGASLAQPIVMIVGRGAWVLPLALLTWGVRLTLHKGEDRAMSRLMFVPIVVALASVFASTLTPPDGWPHTYGLGGLFGDTVLGLFLTILPFGTGAGVNLLAFLLGAGVLVSGAFVTGFTKDEMQSASRLLLLGLVMAYALGLRLMGRGAAVSMRAAEVMKARIGDEIEARREQARREQALEDEEEAAMRAVPPPSQTQRVAAVVRAHAAKRMASVQSARPQPEDDEDLIDTAPQHRMPPAMPRVMPRAVPQMSYEEAEAELGWDEPETQDYARPQPPIHRAFPPAASQAPAAGSTLAAPPRMPEPEEPSGGLLSRVPQLLRRGEPRETTATEYPTEPALVAETRAPDDDRIRSRITDAIRSRVRPDPMPPFRDGRIEPSLTKGRGPKPLVISKGIPPAPAAAVGAGLVATQAGMAAAGHVARAGMATVGQAQGAMTAGPAHHAPQAPEQSSFLPDDPYYAEQIFDDGDAGFEAAQYDDQTDYDHDDISLDSVEEPRRAEPPVHVPEARRVAEPPLTASRAAPAVDPTQARTPAPSVAGPQRPVAPTPQAAAPTAQPAAPQVAPAEVKRSAPQPAPAAAQAPQPATPKFPEYEYPPLDLLMDPASIQRHHLPDDQLEENARMLEGVLEDYGVKGEIVSVRPGPVVTMYELEPAPGLKASRVIGLADDIARSMSALSARVSTVPGRSVIGIELPNANREKVVLREILTARDYGDMQMKLPLALGKDIGGEPVIANLAKMPHLLIAGTTGSGKSVAINTMILSLLYKLSPEECRLIMIDPKMLELSVYDGIPHLLSPVVTDPKKAVVALKWVVGEMEERYRKMSKMGVRNIDGYNGRVKEALSKGEMFSRTVQTGFDEETGDPIFETDEFQPEVLPYIVVIVDEMADLMMVAGKEIEACIQRLAQMARASGIHLIMATQRPSVDVITGTIKANFPTRISFSVTSKIDSRTILGEQGAEQLLGMGDMLYMAGGSKITRVHGPFCSDEEVEEIVTYLKGFGPPDYVGGVVEGPEDGRESDIDAVLGLGGSSGSDNAEDALYDQAVQIVARDRKCSTSYIQRKLAIGYNKAARLVEQMEDQGVVSPANHVGKRDVLVPEPH